MSVFSFSRRLLLQRCLVAVAVLAAARAGAPPPISSFPADVAPSNAQHAPHNAHVFLFGTNAPPRDQLGVVVTVNAVPVAASALLLTRLGCCLVRVDLPADIEAPADVAITATAPGGEVSSAFVLDAAADLNAPTLEEPALLDDVNGHLVIGVHGTDDVALAGFLVQDGDTVLSATSTRFVLEADVRPGRCVDVRAIDLAGNLSPPQQVCAAGEGEGEGDGEGEGEGEGDLGGCTAVQASPSSRAPRAAELLLIPPGLVLFPVRRPRRRS